MRCKSSCSDHRSWDDRGRGGDAVRGGWMGLDFGATAGCGVIVVLWLSEEEQSWNNGSVEGWKWVFLRGGSSSGTQLVFGWFDLKRPFREQPGTQSSSMSSFRLVYERLRPIKSLPQFVNALFSSTLWRTHRSFRSFIFLITSQALRCDTLGSTSHHILLDKKGNSGFRTIVSQPSGRSFRSECPGLTPLKDVLFRDIDGLLRPS